MTNRVFCPWSPRGLVWTDWRLTFDHAGGELVLVAGKVDVRACAQHEGVLVGVRVAVERIGRGGRKVAELEAGFKPVQRRHFLAATLPQVVDRLAGGPHDAEDG